MLEKTNLLVFQFVQKTWVSYSVVLNLNKHFIMSRSMSSCEDLFPCWCCKRVKILQPLEDEVMN